MNEKPDNYNLLDKNWIPVLWSDGKVNRVEIKKALTQAHKIRQIAASNPMDRVAIIRFLLALLYWCRGSPQNDENSKLAESFPEDWFSKLDENKDCFNLLGDGKRFYQSHVVEPCKNENKDHEVISLIQEIPNGDDKWHFRHSTDKVNGFCQACCALGLLRLPIFTSGEGRGWHQGINGKPPIYFLQIGKTLLETLFLNWKSSKDLGEPAWIQPVLKFTHEQDVPLLTGLTLLARRVWLHDPAKESGFCIGCGSSKIPIIKTCEYQSSGPLENNHWEDPNVIYLENTSKRRSLVALDLTKAGNFRKKSSYFKNASVYSKNKADGFRMDHPYLDFIAVLIGSGKLKPTNKPMTLLIVGFATDKAKNIDVWEQTIYIPPNSLMPEITQYLIYQWKDEGFKLPRDFSYKKEKERESNRKHHEFASLVVSIRQHIEGRLTNRIGKMLSGGEEAWQEAALEYRPMMEVIAKSLSPGFTTAAVQRRQQIENTIPDMRPKTEAEKKPRRKKGGNK
jgi:hypothetical protein